MMWKSVAGAAAMGVLLLGPAQAAQEAQHGELTLYERADSTGSFGPSLSAVNAEGLSHALKGAESWTVLAPTDEFFAPLPDGTVAHLLKPEHEDALTALLHDHLTQGSSLASPWVNEALVPQTEAGNEIMIDSTASPVLIGDAAGNGIVPSLDGLLMLPSS